MKEKRNDQIDKVMDALENVSSKARPDAPFQEDLTARLLQHPTTRRLSRRQQWQIAAALALLILANIFILGRSFSQERPQPVDEYRMFLENNLMLPTTPEG